MGKSLESDIVLGKKTFLMIQAIEKNKHEINNLLELAKDDFNLGLNEIRSFMELSGIKRNTENEISEILNIANRKINKLTIDKSKMLYFSELIENRGN